MIFKRSFVVIKCIFFLLFLNSLAAATCYDNLKEQYNKIKPGTSRSVIVSLGGSFYKCYSSDIKSDDAYNALLFSARTYKLSYELYGIAVDADLAIKYLRIVYTNSDGEEAAEAYLESAELFIQRKDLASAQLVLNRLKKSFPNTIHELAATSMLTDLAMMQRVGSSEARASSGNFAKDSSSKAKSNPIFTGNSKDPLNASSGDVVIKKINYFSADGYTRVVIETDKAASFDEHWLQSDIIAKQPPRLFIDVFNSTVEQVVDKNQNIKDGIIKSIRWAYNKPGVTRVVLDSQSIKDHKVFQLTEPHRIVIDVSNSSLAGKKGPAEKQPVKTKEELSPGNGVVIAGGTKEQTLASLLGLKIKTIVIDPGHGGKDPGCKYHNLEEKAIVLDIAKQLKVLLNKKNPDIKVYLTREKDVFIPLEDRTAIANKYKADLFISIHINAARNKNAKGVETYVLNGTTDAQSLAVAASENKVTTKSMSDLQGILKDLMLNSKLQESLLLASSVQTSMVKSLKLTKAENLGVKQAPFYVLVGAKMPSVLVEAGFLSNAAEAKKLATASHRKSIAEGIHKGIESYISQYNK